MTEKPTTLEQWFVPDTSHYRDGKICLVGVVTGHPKKPDGSLVQTSPVAKVEGRLITTESGTLYWLGEPEPAYRQWLAVHRPNWDPEHPVTVLNEPATKPDKLLN